MSNPTIKLAADFSSFESELNKLKTQIASVGDLLKNATGRTELNFGDSQKILNDLIRQYDKLTASSNKSDLSSKKHLETLKQLQKVLTEGAKVSAKIENIGDRNSSTSEFFNNRAANVGQSINDAESHAALQRDRERTAAKLESDRQATTARWANRAASLVSFAGGAMAGGGGSYASGGSAIGGLLGSAFGLPGKLIGSALGGVAGGAIDKTHDTAKNELVAVSELTRRISDVNAQFADLRDSIRFSVSNFAISNEEAAKLAVSFTKLTAVGDVGLISKAIGTSVSAAKQFGIGSDSANEFFSKTTLLGSTKNQNDFNRTMVVLAESARKGGISPKMEELMSSIFGMMSSSASRSLMTGSIGSYADALATGSALPYAGLSKTPGNVAGLINQFSDFTASNGGDQGVKDHRTRSFMMGFPGLDPKWFSRLRQAGAMEDPAELFSPQSPGYKNQDAKGKAEYDEAYSAIKKSGLTIGQAVAQYLKTLGLGAAETDAAFGAMTGSGPIKGSALEEIINSPKKWGELEAKLDSFGVSKAQQGKYAGRYAELNQGGSAGAIAYYEKLKKDNLLDKDLQKQGDKLSGSEKEKFIYSRVVPSQADDPAYNMQKADLQLQNVISSSLGDLIGIETDAKNALIELVRGLVPKSDFARKMDERELESIKKGIPESGELLSGGKDYPWDYGPMKKRVDDDLLKIRSASTESSKKSAYEDLMQKLRDEPESYPAESVAWAQQAYRGTPATEQELNPGTVDNSPSTQDAGPGYTGALTGRQKEVAAMVMKKSKYDSLFKEAGLKYGVDPLLIKQVSAWESNLNPSAFNKSSNDWGMMQHNKRYFAERGLTDSNWSDPRTNVFAGARLLKQNMDQSHGDLHDTFKRYNGWSAQGEKYADNMMAIHDQIPEGHKSAPQDMKMHATAEIIVKNEQGRELGRAAPVFSTTRRPMQAGVRS